MYSELMRIAFFIPIIAGRGGIETVLANLIKQLRAEGDDPRLFIYSGSRDKEWLQHFPWVKEIGQPKSPRPVRLYRYFQQTVKEMRRWKPDIIVCTHPSTLQIARICRPVSRSTDVPVVLWLHGPLHVYRDIEKALLVADGHICLCKARAEEVEAALARLAPGLDLPVCVSYNGTSVGRKYSVERATTPTFVYVGRLLFGEEKRLGDIVRAASQLRGEFRILFVGDGPDEEKRKLRELAEKSGISDKLEWLGWRSEPWATIECATALILASSYEGFGLVVIEALSLGLPVIASDCGAIAKEVLEPGKTGWTFPVGDVAALASIMQSLIDRTVALPNSDGLKQIGTNFSIESTAASFRYAVEQIRARKTRIP